jgi:hypothetical protein
MNQPLKLCAMTVTTSFSPENIHWQKCSIVFGPANTNSFFPHVWQILSLSTPSCYLWITTIDRRNRLTSFSILNVPKMTWSSVNKDTNRMTTENVFIDNVSNHLQFDRESFENYGIRCCKRVLLWCYNLCSSLYRSSYDSGTQSYRRFTCTTMTTTTMWLPVWLRSWVVTTSVQTATKVITPKKNTLMNG